jgi:hypothetical protein
MIREQSEDFMSSSKNVANQRMCIWCGGIYQRSDDHATQCYCRTCETILSDEARARIFQEWMAIKHAGAAARAVEDAGQALDQSWPDQFPIRTRDILPT